MRTANTKKTKVHHKPKHSMHAQNLNVNISCVKYIYNQIINLISYMDYIIWHVKHNY